MNWLDDIKRTLSGESAQSFMTQLSASGHRSTHLSEYWVQIFLNSQSWKGQICEIQRIYFQSRCFINMGYSVNVIDKNSRLYPCTKKSSSFRLKILTRDSCVGHQNLTKAFIATLVHRGPCFLAALVWSLLRGHFSTLELASGKASNFQHQKVLIF